MLPSSGRRVPAWSTTPCTRSWFFRRKPASQQPCRPVTRLGWPIPEIEIRFEQAVEGRETAPPLPPFRRTEGRQLQVNGASSESVGHIAQQQKVGRSGEQKVPGAPALIHRRLDGQEQRGRPLHLIQGDRANAKQGFRVAGGLVQHTHVIQAQERASRIDGSDKGGLARLPGARDDRHRQHPETGIHVPGDPPLPHTVHAAK